MSKWLKTSVGKRQDCLVPPCGVCGACLWCVSVVCVVVAVAVVCVVVCVCAVWCGTFKTTPRLYIQNVPAWYRHHGHMCFNMCASHGDGQRCKYTGAFWMDSRREFFSARHTTPDIPHTYRTPNTTPTQRHTRRTERERERRQKKRREKGRREEGGRRKREREKKEKNSILTCTRVACTCRRHSFCSMYHEKRS